MHLFKSNVLLLSMTALACDAFVAPHVPSNAQWLHNSPTHQNSFFGFGLDTKNPTSSSPSSTSNSAKSKALIEKAKDIIYNKSGFYSPFDSDIFSKEFVFRGPIIGPLNKKDYLKTMDAFQVYNAIPDINPNAWGFSIDPQDDNRVWFMVRNSGTFTGRAFLPDSLNYEANGAMIDGCPETFSITFDDDQKMKCLTVGYVADRFSGNTKGQGAAAGIFNAIGLPFPKVGPLLRFAQWFGTEVVDVGLPSYSAKDVPEWWTDKNVGTGGYL
uniref:Uncharacterized protein n=1 Tax=Ditylum brightwellii TaxID=49249 RepID=A0A6U3SEY5_9STRA|mmetsp:Transcript_11815/g.17614  ORF Transcript_11815/g.17614 Transcript_11815/m.17614 type:complete len:270 (+) Transcript_11815:187-996(+)